MTGKPASEAGREIIERTGRLVGEALASVANLCDLDLIVVAGSVALGFGPPFFEPLIEHCTTQPCSRMPGTPG